jgi:predicted nucleotidyltransferase
MKKGYNLLVLKALEFFIENPYSEIYLREFSRKLKISPNTSQRFLDLFSKENLITDIKKANLRYFKANLDNNFFRHIKLAYSIKKLLDSGLVDSLSQEASHIVVFGSVAKGEDDKNSDIDLLIISSNKEKVKEILASYYKKLDKEIIPHIFSFAEWKKQAKINKAFYQEVIINGINLIGKKPIAE